MTDTTTARVRTCIMDGCGKPRRGATYCDMHYARLRRDGAPGEVTQRRASDHTPPAVAAEERLRLIGWDVTPSGCWEYRGVRTRWGYGLIHRLHAHRVSYAAAHGPIGPGLFICHKCDNPPCVNPAHLFAGTPAENSADAVSKGRMARGERQWKARLTDDDVRRIRSKLELGEVQRRIAEEFGVSPMTVTLIKQRKIWAHVD